MDWVVFLLALALMWTVLWELRAAASAVEVLLASLREISQRSSCHDLLLRVSLEEPALSPAAVNMTVIHRLSRDTLRLFEGDGNGRQDVAGWR